MKRGLYQLLPLLPLLSGGCYAAVGGQVQAPLSATSIGTTGGAELDIGLLADFGDAQIFASSRVGFWAGLKEQNRNPEEEEEEDDLLVGGVVGFILAQKPPRGNHAGLNWGVALSYASLLPENSDLGKSGTLVSLMIGPNFTGISRGPEARQRWLKGGFATGITISRLELLEETTWSIGFSIKIISWLDTEYLESLNKK